MKKHIFIILACFSLLSGLFIISHWQDINPDGISYLEVANNYRFLRIDDALNAYWSPVFSWVAIPFTFFPHKIIGIKILQFFLGILWIYTSYLLAFAISNSRSKAFLSVSLVFLFPAITEMWKLVTADLLFAVYINILLVYFFRYFQNKKHQNPLLFGLFIGFGSLIKAFFLPFSIIFILLVAFLSRRLTIKNSLIILMGIIIIPVLWTVVLYQKYEHIVFNSSTNVTYKKFVLQEEYPFLLRTLPPKQGGGSYWYDPSDFSYISFNANKQIDAIKNNFIHIARFLVVNFHIGVLFFLLALYKRRKNFVFPLLFIFIAVWFLLYAFILVEVRYLWPTIPIIVIFIVDRLNKQIALFYFITVAVLFTLNYINQFSGAISSENHFTLARVIEKPCTIVSDTWQRGLYVSYLAGCLYHGVLDSGAQRGTYELADEMSRLQSNYYIAFDSQLYDYFGDFRVHTVLKEHNSIITVFKKVP